MGLSRMSRHPGVVKIQNLKKGVFRAKLNHIAIRLSKMSVSINKRRKLSVGISGHTILRNQNKNKNIENYRKVQVPGKAGKLQRKKAR